MAGKHIKNLFDVLPILALLVSSIGCTPITSTPSNYTLTTTVTPVAAGSISPSNSTYEPGLQVTITATSASGYAFDYWEGAAAGLSPTTNVTMTSNKTIVAHFKTVPQSGSVLTIQGGETILPRPQDAGNVKTWQSPPTMTINGSKTYFATIQTTLGTFKIQLFANEVPVTVNNFVFLSQQGFYDGIIFHRIIKTFMIQAGDPTGTGGGGPGYKFNDELPPKHNYDTGILAMANAGPNTNGSQFFICTGPDAANLNGFPNYTQFGKVVSGMDVVQNIASVPVGVGNPGETSRPVNPPAITKIDISME